MDKNETIALYRRGKDAWNDWAAEMLIRRDSSANWADEARASFVSHEFAEDEHFDGFIFRDVALFHKARFRGDVEFREAQFKGLAYFESTKFEGAILFDLASFEDNAWFSDSQVEGSASFKQVVFKGEAWFHKLSVRSTAYFERSIFQGYTDFSRARFHTHADFLAVQARSAFMMFKTSFFFVPSFEQANFMEAPRLDDINIDNHRKYVPTFSRAGIKSVYRGNREDEVRWRALRRLALQGHDHLGAQRFFREELLARRGVTDKYCRAPFWIGLFYQCASDFGRSFGRPLVCWAAGLLLFAALYNYLGHDTAYPDWLAALGLSLHHGLASLSGFGDKLPEWYARLYGLRDGCALPIIPDAVSFIGFVQSVFSAVMIFLFLLALRNRFRIK